MASRPVWALLVQTVLARMVLTCWATVAGRNTSTLAVSRLVRSLGAKTPVADEKSNRCASDLSPSVFTVPAKRASGDAGRHVP